MARQLDHLASSTTSTTTATSNTLSIDSGVERARVCAKRVTCSSVRQSYRASECAAKLWRERERLSANAMPSHYYPVTHLTHS
jgi:hypothetical protein